MKTYFCKVSVRPGHLCISAIYRLWPNIYTFQVLPLFKLCPPFSTFQALPILIHFPGWAYLSPLSCICPPFSLSCICQALSTPIPLVVVTRSVPTRKVKILMLFTENKLSQQISYMPVNLRSQSSNLQALPNLLKFPSSLHPPPPSSSSHPPSLFSFFFITMSVLGKICSQF